MYRGTAAVYRIGDAVYSLSAFGLCIASEMLCIVYRRETPVYGVKTRKLAKL